MTSFLSPSPPTSPDSPCFDAAVQTANGSADFSPDAGRTVPTPTYRAMEAAFIRWHVTGCFAAAADYQKARQAWELALMDQPTGDAE